jgi:dTDP-4-dehydrorhamnose reductase
VRGAWGTYHLAGAGHATWYDFAKSISNNLEKVGKHRPAIEPISMAQYPTATKRPPNCMLDCQKLEQTFDLRLPAWQDGVEASVNLWARAT